MVPDVYPHSSLLLEGSAVARQVPVDAEDYAPETVASAASELGYLPTCVAVFAAVLPFRP